MRIRAVLTLIVLASAATAAPPPGARCAAAKLRATARQIFGDLACRAHAVSKGRAPDALCDGRSSDGFVRAFDRADTKGCAVTGNQTALLDHVARLDAFVATTLVSDGSTAARKCVAGETAATARKAGGAGGCFAKAVLAGATDDPACASGVDRRFRRAMATLQRRLHCSVDAGAIAAHVDDWQAGVVDAILTGASSTTTTTTAVTTSSTATTSTTTTSTTTTTDTTTTSTTTTETTTTVTTTTGTTLEGQTTTTATSTTTVTTTTSTTTTTTHTTTTHTTTSTTTTTTTTSTTTTTAPLGTFRAVQHIFTTSCALAGCHVPPAPAQDLDLSSAASSYAQLVGVASGQKPLVKRVKPLDYAKSYLYWKITNDSRILGSKMPNNGLTLSASDVNSIKQWILNGAPND